MTFKHDSCLAGSAQYFNCVVFFCESSINRLSINYYKPHAVPTPVFYFAVIFISYSKNLIEDDFRLPVCTYLRACWNLLGFVCAAPGPRARPNAAAVRAPDIRHAPQCPADKNNRSITVRARVVVVSWLPTQPYQPWLWRHESSGVAEPCAPAPLARAFWRTHAHGAHFLPPSVLFNFFLARSFPLFVLWFYIYIFVFLFVPMSRAHTPKHAHNNMTYIARSPIRTLILLLYYYSLRLIPFVFLWYYYYYTL